MSINWNANIIKATLDREKKGDHWNPYKALFMVIGGGGAGGSSVTNANGAGGGGAGHLVSGSMIVQPNTPFNVNIGAGGLPTGGDGINGQPTIFSSGSETYFYALGGGGGVRSGDGKNGGSGGGALGGPSFLEQYTGGLTLPIPSGSEIQSSISGSNGGNGIQYSPGTQDTFLIGGGGGGATSVGSTPTTSFGGAGGAGFTIAFIGETVAEGGDGGGAPAAGRGVVQGAGANATTIGSGGGGANGLASGGTGASGSVIIAYIGEQKGLGGEISTYGDYTVHHFTGSGVFQSTGYRHNGT